LRNWPWKATVLNRLFVEKLAGWNRAPIEKMAMETICIEQVICRETGQDNQRDGKGALLRN
jgi:hypothetical protein